MTLLIFDIDGTLVQSTPLEDEAFVASLEAGFGFSGVDTDWSSYENVTDSGILQEVFRKHAGRAPTRNEARRFRLSYETALRALLERHPEEGAEIPGAAGFVRDLVADPVLKIAYATGNWRSVARLKLDRAGLERRAIPMACADDGLAREALLRTAIGLAETRYGIESFDGIIAFGDASWDARAAEAMGIPFVGVGTRWAEAAGWPCAACVVDYRDGAAVRAMLAAVR